MKSKQEKQRIFVADFETTVYDNQESTEVWAAACVEMFSGEEPKVFHSIDDLFGYFDSLKCSVIVYFHNLKFDGSFIINHLLSTGYKQAYYEYKEQKEDDVLGLTLRHIEWSKDSLMPPRTFKYSISNMGQWYTIRIHRKKYYITIRDSLKLLPYSVKKIGKDFSTKHKKLDIEYTGHRYAGCEITEQEQEYIKNDVYVPSEALEIMFNQGHDKLTIGSCCLAEFKNIFTQDCYTYFMKKEKWDEYFPDLYQISIDKSIYGYDNAADYIRTSYRGGWCYLAEGKENKIIKNGWTIDVNSLYPSSMHSMSGNVYPYGTPTFWHGDIPEEAKENGRYYFVRIRCSFKLKEGYLPYIQIKRNFLYKSTEMLKTSDIYDKINDVYYSYQYDSNGNAVPVTVDLTLTMTDYEIIQKHYDLSNLQVLDGCWFKARAGMFDEYIDKYKEIKMNSKGAIRETAKLFLNNLYGKFAASNNSSFKLCRLEDGILKFDTIMEFNKMPGYIPIGSAITSYSRCFTVTAAQLNYYGPDKPGFIYADTDSLHLDLPISEVKGVKLHDSEFCHWKPESKWDIGFFVRAKTYIEHVVGDYHKDFEPYYNIKCAGMPEFCKKLFECTITPERKKKKAIIKSLGGVDKLTQDEKSFICRNRAISDFTIGMQIPGKLVAKQIKGGVVLSKTTFVMRE